MSSTELLALTFMSWCLNINKWIKTNTDGSSYIASTCPCVLLEMTPNGVAEKSLMLPKLTTQHKQLLTGIWHGWTRYILAGDCMMGLVTTYIEWFQMRYIVRISIFLVAYKSYLWAYYWKHRKRIEILRCYRTNSVQMPIFVSINEGPSNPKIWRYPFSHGHANLHLQWQWTEEYKFNCNIA